LPALKKSAAAIPQTANSWFVFIFILRFPFVFGLLLFRF